MSEFTICPNESELLSKISSGSHVGFLVGHYAEIHGLWSRPELESMLGRLHVFDTGSGRWRVLLESGEYIIIKPEFMTHYDVPQGVQPMQPLLPEPSGASVTSRLVMSVMSIPTMSPATPPQLYDAAGLAEHIVALAHEVFGNRAAMRELVRMGCLASLVTLLASASQIVQELAAFALQLLVGWACTLIINAGAVPRLVSLLFGSSCSKVQKKAAETLTILVHQCDVSNYHRRDFEEIDPHKLVLLLVPGGANSQSVQGLAALLCGGLARDSPPF
ncbi:unnamed protein product [Polarella glacialis]|uniref:Uncharacterized protein n=1 Tax=Polarella glacialis TaxID=89957 RepID=A0A813KB67_POLGL|nr:unnamed protein product [Polarella glacialis]